jgi:hypothetical protein
MYTSQDCEVVLKNTTSFCGKQNFVKSDREELFRKMPPDILGSAKEELQSECLSKVLIMDGSVSWGILEHGTCFACFAAIFQIWEFCFMMGVLNFVGNGKDIQCLHRLHQVGSKQKQSP